MSDHWNALGQRNFMPETALSRSPRSFVGFDSSYYMLVAGVNGPDGRLEAVSIVPMVGPLLSSKVLRTGRFEVVLHPDKSTAAEVPISKSVDFTASVSPRTDTCLTPSREVCLNERCYWVTFHG